MYKCIESALQTITLFMKVFSSLYFFLPILMVAYGISMKCTFNMPSIKYYYSKHSAARPFCCIFFHSNWVNFSELLASLNCLIFFSSFYYRRNLGMNESYSTSFSECLINLNCSKKLQIY